MTLYDKSLIVTEVMSEAGDLTWSVTLMGASTTLINAG